MANPAKEILSGKPHIPNPKETKISGYITSDVPRSCGSCEYLEKGTLCRNYVVLRDSQILKDQKTGLRIVDPVFGCCNEWEASKDAEKRAANGDFKKALEIVVK